MLKKVCPICGKNVEIFLEGICIDCFRNDFLKKHKVPEKIEIYQCKYCGKYSITKKYLFENLENALEHYVNHAIKFEDFVVKFENEIKVYKDNLLIFSFPINLKIKPFTCKFCSLKNIGYRQAIIQLRTKFNNIILKEIEKIVESEKKDFYAFISRIEEKKDGIDVFIGSKNVAYKILRFLEGKYSINYKISRKLVGIKKGKKVYLDTISIRNGS